MGTDHGRADIQACGTGYQVYGSVQGSAWSGNVTRNDLGLVFGDPEASGGGVPQGMTPDCTSTFCTTTLADAARNFYPNSQLTSEGNNWGDVLIWSGRRIHLDGMHVEIRGTNSPSAAGSHSVIIGPGVRAATKGAKLPCAVDGDVTGGTCDAISALHRFGSIKWSNGQGISNKTNLNCPDNDAGDGSTEYGGACYHFALGPNAQAADGAGRGAVDLTEIFGVNGAGLNDDLFIYDTTADLAVLLSEYSILQEGTGASILDYPAYPYLRLPGMDRSQNFVVGVLAAGDSGENLKNGNEGGSITSALLTSGNALQVSAPVDPTYAVHLKRMVCCIHQSTGTADSGDDIQFEVETYDATATLNTTSARAVQLTADGDGIDESCSATMLDEWIYNGDDQMLAVEFVVNTDNGTAMSALDGNCDLTWSN
jgi:hypothetical protein